MKKIISLLFVLATLFSPQFLFAKELSLEEVQDAVCRVSVSTSGAFGFGASKVYGTGTVYKESDDKYYIVTNGHVVGAGKSATVEFFKAGYKSAVIPAKIEFVRFRPGTSMDMAVLSINKSVFTNTTNRPRVIQFAPEAFSLKPKNKIYGAGCPAGRWCQLWFARINKDDGNTISFNMPPEGGQSGSAILTTITDKNGEKHTAISGILSWRYGESGNEWGGGVSLSRVYEIFKNKAPKPDTIDASWVCAAAGICSNCGRPKNEHYVIWNNRTKKARTTSDGKDIPFWCQINTGRNGLSSDEEFITIADYEVRGPGCNRPPKPPEPPSNDGPPNGGIWPDDLEPKEDEPPVAPVPPIEDPLPTPKPPVPPKVDPNIAKLAELEKRISSLNEQIKKLEGSNNGLDAQVKVFKDKLAQLEAEKAKLEAENKKVSQSVAALDEQLKKSGSDNSVLLAQKKELEAKKTETEKALSDVTANVSDMKNQINSVKVESDAKIVSITGELKSALSNKEQLASELSKLAESHKNTLNQLNIPYISENFGGLGEFLTAILGALASGTIITTFWHKFIYPQLVRRLGWFPTKIIGLVGKRKLRKYLGTEKKTRDENVNSGYNNSSEQPIEPDYAPSEELQPQSTIELPKNVGISDIKTKQVVSTKDNAKDYPVLFFEQNKDNLLGFSVREWAVKTGLYKMAVQYLKEGRLRLKDGSQPANGKKSAEAIEDYVTDRFVSEIRLSSLLPENNIHHEAYLGYLYWQAVQKLASGEFSVLGHKEAAEAVERYVKTEFMKKVKV